VTYDQEQEALHSLMATDIKDMGTLLRRIRSCAACVFSERYSIGEDTCLTKDTLPRRTRYQGGLCIILRMNVRLGRAGYFLGMVVSFRPLEKLPT
jgi:hypothetical protein